MTVVGDELGRGVTAVGDGLGERGDGVGARPHCTMCLGAKFTLRAALVDTIQPKSGAAAAQCIQPNTRDVLSMKSAKIKYFNSIQNIKGGAASQNTCQIFTRSILAAHYVSLVSLPVELLSRKSRVRQYLTMRCHNQKGSALRWATFSCFIINRRES